MAVWHTRQSVDPRTLSISAPLGPAILNAGNSDDEESFKGSNKAKIHTQVKHNSFDSSHKKTNTNDSWKPLPVKPGWHNRVYRWWKRQVWWPTDTFNAASSLVLFGSVLIILGVFNGQPNPEFRFGITLNALISVLATLGTFTIMIPCSDALAQLKWTWFLSNKPLNDFHLIDNASRGPAGSFWLLVKRRGGLLASTGSILTILILAINPFVQQVIKYENRSIITSKAFMPVANVYNTYVASPPSPDLSMKGAINGGLLNSNGSFDVVPSCPTGNCTWPSYESLAVCSTCANITEFVEIVNETSGGPYPTWTMTYKLPNNLSVVMEQFTNTFQPHFLMDDCDALPVIMKNMNVLNHFTAINVELLQQDSTGAWDPALGYIYRAAECALYWCVKTHNATMQNGLIREFSGSNPFTNNSGASVDLSDDFQGDNNFGVTTILQPPESNQTYQVSADANHAVGLYLLNLFNASVPSLQTGDNSQGVYTVGSPEYGTDSIFPNDQSQALWHAFNTPPHSLDQMMAKMAQSMTQNVRTKPNAGKAVVGDAYSEQATVTVEWAWMALPIAMLILTFGFLCIVALNTREQDLEAWRTNSLATLVHGLDEETRRELSVREPNKSLEEACDGVLIRLSRSTDGWKLRRVPED